MKNMILKQNDRFFNRVLIPTCFDDSIATFASWVKSDYEGMFLSSWDFPYHSANSSSISNCFRWKNNKINHLRDYHGLRFQRYTKDKSLTDAVGLIKASLYKGIPVIVSISAYWVHWDKDYQKNNEVIHNFIITRIDEERKELIGVDPYHFIEKVSISYEEFNKGYMTSFHYLGKDEVLHTFEYYNNVMIEELNNQIKEKMFSNMDHFKNDLLSRELTSLDSIKIPYHINKVISGRIEFSQFLTYLSSLTTPDKLFEEISAELKKSAEQWNLINAYLIKYFIVRKEEILKKVALKIDDAIGMEKRIFKKITLV